MPTKQTSLVMTSKLQHILSLASTPRISRAQLKQGLACPYKTISFSSKNNQQSTAKAGLSLSVQDNQLHQHSGKGSVHMA